MGLAARGAVYGPKVAENRAVSPLTQRRALPHGGTMNGFLAIGCICREIIS
jgi:hypothetical protein